MGCPASESLPPPSDAGPLHGIHLYRRDLASLSLPLRDVPPGAGWHLQLLPQGRFTKEDVSVSALSSRYCSVPLLPNCCSITLICHLCSQPCCDCHAASTLCLVLLLPACRKLYHRPHTAPAGCFSTCLPLFGEPMPFASGVLSPRMQALYSVNGAAAEAP